VVDVRKILVIKLRAIGDVVLSSALLPGLREFYGDAKIHFMVESQGKEVLENNPYVDQIVVLPLKEWKKLSGVKAWLSGLRFLRMVRKEKYDVVFDLFGNPRSAFITWITGAPLRVGFSFCGRKYAYNKRIVPRGGEVHEVEFNLDALRALNIPVIKAFPLFPIPKKDKDFIDRWIKENGLEKSFLVGLNPWGSWQAKRWGLEKFAALTDKLVETYQAKVVVLWGPGEREHAEKIKALAHHPVFIAPETSLKELGALLSRCQLVVANDSGPMHISAAVGTKTIGIFGPTRWQLQGPYGRGHGVAYKKGLACLGCNRLSCEKMTCMKDLSVDEVMEVVEQVVGKDFSQKRRRLISAER